MTVILALFQICVLKTSDCRVAFSSDNKNDSGPVESTKWIEFTSQGNKPYFMVVNYPIVPTTNDNDHYRSKAIDLGWLHYL